MTWTPQRRAEQRARVLGLGNLRLGTIPKGPCSYCGQPATTMDHVIPRDHAWGTPCHAGCHRVPACYRCNSSKGSRTPEQWLASGLYKTPGRGR